MIRLTTEQLDQIVAHAKVETPSECCGLIGGDTDGNVATIYELRNEASDKTIAYEAAPEDLFSAQREMRERGEQLLAIYHSHPRSLEPAPSETDVRLAYYPDAVYFIVGLGGPEPVLRAFRISERDDSWEPVEYEVSGE